jgi:hypothetical protein
MNKTTYQNRIPSPFQTQTLRRDPLQEEIDKNVGSFTLTAVVEEDKQTRASFKHISGFIAYVCTLKRGNEIIGVGRGSAILTRMNKWVDRAIRSAYAGSVIDAVIRATRTLDAMYLQSNDQKNPGYVNEETNDIDYSPEMATEKQKSYLLQLVHMNIEDEDERSHWESEIAEMTKEEASAKIQSFRQ